MPQSSTVSSLAPAGSVIASTSSTRTCREKECPTAAVTLRSLYFRATRAFLQRDINLTHTLITSALPLIPSPPPLDDPLSSWRKKWDILRVTLETTVYASPPPDPEALPSHFRANLMLSPQSLLAALYTRSLVLFTPTLSDSDIHGGPNVAYLPTQILITLVLASVKLGVPDVGKGMIEDWLARRDTRRDAVFEVEEYEKVIELYCLHILPRLEEWDYATEFLQYESELGSVRRQRLMYSLETLHSTARQRRRSTPSTPSLSPTSPGTSRPVSPADSSVSSSSEDTATPRTPRLDGDATKGNRKPFSMSMTSLVHPSSVSGSTNTSRTATPIPTSVIPKQRSKLRRRPPAENAPVADPPVSASSAKFPSTLAVVKSAVSFVKSSFTLRMNLATLLIIAFALISFIRFRRSRRPKIANGGHADLPMTEAKNMTIKIRANLNGASAPARSAVEEVRKNLGSASGISANISSGVFRTLWNEISRAVGDTVRMGGQGLV